MNDSTDKKINGSAENAGCCNCDYSLAFLLLRGWLAVRALFTGIEKFGAYKSIQQPLLDANGQPDASGAVIDVKVKFYSMANYSGIPAGLVLKRCIFAAQSSGKRMAGCPSGLTFSLATNASKSKGAGSFTVSACAALRKAMRKAGGRTQIFI